MIAHRLRTKHSVELQIQELVLHGFAPGDRYLIGEAMERELARLLEQGVPPPLASGAEVASLDAGTFHVPPESGAEAIGAQVAGALYGNLMR